MSLYILDTDILSLFQYSHPTVCSEVQKHSLAELAITILTVEEQLSGWYSELRKAKKPSALAAIYERMTRTVQFFSHLPILSFTEAAIKRYEALRQLKLKVAKTDLRIASIVIENSGVLVTRNERDFQQIPELRIENWAN